MVSSLEMTLHIIPSHCIEFIGRCNKGVCKLWTTSRYYYEKTQNFSTFSTLTELAACRQPGCRSGWFVRRIPAAILAVYLVNQACKCANKSAFSQLHHPIHGLYVSECPQAGCGVLVPRCLARQWQHTRSLPPSRHLAHPGRVNKGSNEGAYILHSELWSSL